MSRYRWVVLFASVYAFVSFAFALQTVPPVMGSIIREYNISFGEAGLLMSVVVIPGIFLAIPAGILTDRYGVRIIGFLSTIIISLGCVITAMADSITILLFGRLILGIGGAFIATAMPAIIPQWFPPKNIGKAMGIYGMNMPLASVIAFTSASFLMLNYNWKYPFYLSVIIAVLNIIVFTLIIKEGPLKHKH